MKISLYIHIPFCETKCDYCDFFSVAAADLQTQKMVLDTIIIELKTKLQNIETPHIESVFIGGGTPSVIHPQIFNSFLLEIDKVINSIKAENCEYSTEANIGSCTADFMQAAKDGGVNRLSIGVQSFDNATLKNIGRKCNVGDIFTAAEDIRAFWRDCFSLDIMSGITPDYMSDVESALLLKPDHFSIYQLTVEENTLLYQQIRDNLIQPPNEQLQSQAIKDVNCRLSSAGYKRYEISNYSTDENRCLHNMRYWEMQSYLGLGPSAVTSIYNHDSGIRTTNSRDIEKYITAVTEGRSDKYSESENLSFKDLLIEHFIMGCRLCSGINEDVFINRFGKPSCEFIPVTAEKWNKNGFLQKGVSALNNEGLLYLDSFLADVYDEITEYCFH